MKKLLYLLYYGLYLTVKYVVREYDAEAANGDIALILTTLLIAVLLSLMRIVSLFFVLPSYIFKIYIFLVAFVSLWFYPKIIPVMKRHHEGVVNAFVAYSKWQKVALCIVTNIVWLLIAYYGWISVWQVKMRCLLGFFTAQCPTLSRGSTSCLIVCCMLSA